MVTPIATATQDGGQAYAWTRFAGSGTVGKVAAQERRDYTLIELQHNYIDMAKKTVKEGETGIRVAEQKAGQRGLFDERTKP